MKGQARISHSLGSQYFSFLSVLSYLLFALYFLFIFFLFDKLLSFLTSSSTYSQSEEAGAGMT